jgi:NAD(P)-dependent dehydrogenase (short-subunit alcohol dehydrogenase family)
MRLKNRVAIITGAGAGIAKAVTLRYAAEGARVVIAGITPEMARLYCYRRAASRLVTRRDSG